jgi:hypothetical protein
VAAALAPQLFPLLQLAGCEEAAAATLAAGCVAALTRLLPNDVGGGLPLLLMPSAHVSAKRQHWWLSTLSTPAARRALSRHTLAGHC